MTKSTKTTLTMAGNSRRPAAGRGPAQPPRGRKPGRGREPPPRGKSSTKRPRGASKESRIQQNIFENLRQSSFSSSDSESDKASKASSKKSRAEFKDTEMADDDDIQEISGDESSTFTTDDEEQYDPAADAHKLQQSSEDEEEQEDEEEGLYPEEGDGEEKEDDEDQRREEPDDLGTEDDEMAKDDTRQNLGTENLLDDSSVSSTDPFTAETEVSGVKVKTSEAISVYVRPPTVVEIVNSVEYSRWKKLTRPCKCGSCTHKTTRSDACPLNKGRLQADALLKGTSVPKLTSARQKKGAKDIITTFKTTIGYQQLVKGIAREAYSEAQASSRTQSVRANTATPPPANDDTQETPAKAPSTPPPSTTEVTPDVRHTPKARSSKKKSALDQLLAMSPSTVWTRIEGSFRSPASVKDKPYESLVWNVALRMMDRLMDITGKEFTLRPWDSEGDDVSSLLKPKGKRGGFIKAAHDFEYPDMRTYYPNISTSPPDKGDRTYFKLFLGSPLTYDKIQVEMGNILWRELKANIYFTPLQTVSSSTTTHWLLYSDPAMLLGKTYTEPLKAFTNNHEVAFAVKKVSHPTGDYDSDSPRALHITVPQDAQYELLTPIEEAFSNGATRLIKGGVNYRLVPTAQHLQGGDDQRYAIKALERHKAFMNDRTYLNRPELKDIDLEFAKGVTLRSMCLKATTMVEEEKVALFIGVEKVTQRGKESAGYGFFYHKTLISHCYKWAKRVNMACTGDDLGYPMVEGHFRDGRSGSTTGAYVARSVDFKKVRRNYTCFCTEKL